MQLDKEFLVDMMERRNIKIKDVAEKTGLDAKVLYELFYEGGELRGHHLIRLSMFFKSAPHLLIKNNPMTIIHTSPKFVRKNKII